jgi:F0F1-type ATP synthase delta subunit
MATSVYANNLAKALFETALKERELVKWLGELRLISDLAKDAAVSSVLQKASVPLSEKSKLIKDRAGDISAQVLNYHGVEGAEVAEVTTAIPLDEGDMLELGKKLAGIVGRPVVIKAKVDPSIVGGIRIMVGDKLIDGSLRHRLDMLSKELV